MPYKIRTKLVIAFLIAVLPFLIIGGIITFYNMDKLHKSIHDESDISEETYIVHHLVNTMNMAVMSVNAYAITGDKKYIDEFQKTSKNIESNLKDMEGFLTHQKPRAEPTIAAITEKRQMLEGAKTALEKIRDISLKIFAIPNPVGGNRHAASLMEEMNYKWAYPAIDKLILWDEMSRKECRDTCASSDRAFRQLWIVMIAGAGMLLAFGIAVYCRLFRPFVRSIVAIHERADAIAKGDFKTRLDIKTKDEFEQIASAINEMSAQLDSLYSNMQAMVEERTREVKALLNASQSVLKHRSFTDRARAIFYAAKELIGASAGYVALVSENGTRNELLFLDTGGRECAVDQSLPMPIRGLREQAYKTGKPVYDNNFHNSEWMRLMPEGHVRVDNVLFAPITLEGNAVGLLGLANKPAGFNDNDARMLSAFGDIVNIALSEGKSVDALMESEEKYRTMIESATDMIWMLDAEGKFTFINKQSETVGGYKVEEVMGRHYSAHVHPDDLPVREEMFRRTISGERTQLTFRALRKDNGEKVLTLKVNSVPIYKEGKVIGIVNFGRDITELEKTEEHLKQRIDELEQFRKVTIKRELRIEEMRKRIEELEKKLGIKGA